MATPEENAATIVAKAAELDALVTQYRAAKAVIDAAELEIRKAFPGRVFARDGQERLASYAHSQMVKPSIDGDRSVGALASSAWADLLEI